MKELVAEVQASVFMEYERAAEKFGKANNSQHESYAVILEEYEEALTEQIRFKQYIESYWERIKRNMDTESMLVEMRELGEHAAAEWVQVAAMCYKAMQ